MRTLDDACELPLFRFGALRFPTHSPTNHLLEAAAASGCARWKRPFSHAWSHRTGFRCDDFSVCCSVAYVQSGPGFPLVPLHRRQCKTRSAAHLFRANAESIVSRQAIDASKHRWHQARKSAIGAPERRGYAQKGSKQNDSSAAWSSASWCNRLSETI